MEALPNFLLGRDIFASELYLNLFQTDPSPIALHFGPGLTSQDLQCFSTRHQRSERGPSEAPLKIVIKPSYYSKPQIGFITS